MFDRRYNFLILKIIVEKNNCGISYKNISDYVYFNNYWEYKKYLKGLKVLNPCWAQVTVLSSFL